MLRSILALVVLMMVACGGTQTDAAEATPATSGEGTSTGQAPTDQTGATSAAIEAPADDETPSGDAPRGRMMFTQCTDPRSEMCTKEYQPVCGVVDTGVRCIAAPCDEATEQRNFGNACMACAEAKTTGYWPVSCEALGDDAR